MTQLQEQIVSDAQFASVLGLQADQLHQGASALPEVNQRNAGETAFAVGAAAVDAQGNYVAVGVARVPGMSIASPAPELYETLSARIEAAAQNAHLQEGYKTYLTANALNAQRALEQQQRLARQQEQDEANGDSRYGKKKKNDKRR